LTYVLDTNHVIGIIERRPPRLCEALEVRISNAAPISIPTVVLFELWYAVARSKRQHDNAHRLKVLLRSPIEVLAFDEEDARAAGDIGATLEARGAPIGPYDYLIAAQALRRGAILVTANSREFSRLEGLVCEDWTQ
jgi:tRNA(fMet)-specific endonuclease VapC